MTPATAQKIAESIAAAGWNSRIEFNMHGEPSLNPDKDEIVSIFRAALPKASMLMLTNGHGFVKDAAAQINAIFQAGLNTIGMSDYRHAGSTTVADVLDQVLAGETAIDVRLYPDEKIANPHKRRRPNDHTLVIIDDITKAKRGTHSYLSNHCGCGAPPNEKMAGKRCVLPFRELSIRWDGNVAICCNDFRGVLKIGNVAKEGVQKIWDSPIFAAARRKLYWGQRDISVCKGCDAKQPRIGLVQRTRKPLPGDDKILRLASRGKPYTAAVKLSWER